MESSTVGALQVAPAYFFLIDRIQVGDWVLWGDPSEDPNSWNFEPATALTDTQIHTETKQFARNRQPGTDLGMSLERKDRARILDVFPHDRDSADVYEHLGRVLRIQPGDQVTWCRQPGDPDRITEPVLSIEDGEVVTPSKRFIRARGLESTSQSHEAAWICEVTPAQIYS